MAEGPRRRRHRSAARDLDPLDHAQASDDSGVPNEARIRSFLAEGIDVIVTTDHDHLGWYEPALAALGARVVQMNHPLGRAPGFDRGSFLTHLGVAGLPYDASLPLDAEPNRLLLEAAADGRTRAIDFDAIEVMNGRDWDQYLRTREVWYSLLR